MLSIHHFAILLTLLLLVYHQVTTLIPLFPWNDVERYSRKEMALEAGINGLLMGMGFLCLLQANTGFAHWYPLFYYPFLLLGECVDWWIPYFSQAFAEGRKIWDYDSHFSRTFKLIPHRPGKRTPDANHIVLHSLTLITLLVVYLDRVLIS